MYKASSQDNNNGVMDDVGAEVKACLFVDNLSSECHGDFKTSLVNSYNSVGNIHPKTMVNSLSMVDRYM